MLFFIYISIQILAGFNVGVCHTLVEREQLHDGGGSAAVAVGCEDVSSWLAS